MAFAMSLLASVITFVFAGVVLVQYARRPRLYRLAWGLALVFYGVATSVQCATEALGWSTAAFRAWYLAGGLLTAAYLGQGTALLLLPRRLSLVLLGLLVLASGWAVYRTATVPLVLSAVLPPAGKITPQAGNLPSDLRALAALLNIYGTLLLVGGALWSAIVFFDRILDRRRRAGHRVVSNLLIAGGALIVAGAGSLETFGHGEYLYAAEIIGIAVIFLGFLRSRESFGLPLPALPLPHGASHEPAYAPPPTTSARAVRSLRRLADRTTPQRGR
jgi:hypothetical protein